MQEESARLAELHRADMAVAAEERSATVAVTAITMAESMAALERAVADLQERTGHNQTVHEDAVATLKRQLRQQQEQSEGAQSELVSSREEAMAAMAASHAEAAAALRVAMAQEAAESTRQLAEHMAKSEAAVAASAAHAAARDEAIAALEADAASNA